MKRAPRELFELPHGFTTEEIAAALSVEEKRLVPVEEVRRIEMQALRKVRRALLARGLSFENLSMG